MQPAPRRALGQTQAYTLGDVRFVRGVAANGRGCTLVWHAGAYEVVSGTRVLARRGTEIAGKLAQDEYIARGVVGIVGVVS